MFISYGLNFAEFLKVAVNLIYLVGSEKVPFNLLIYNIQRY